MSWLRNLTADAILIGGWLLIAIVSVPFILIEIIYHAGLLGWAVWFGIVWLIWKARERKKEADKTQES